MTFKKDVFAGQSFEIQPKMRVIMTELPIFAQADIMTGIFGLHTGIRAPDAGKSRTTHRNSHPDAGNSQTATVIRAPDAGPG